MSHGAELRVANHELRRRSQGSQDVSTAESARGIGCIGAKGYRMRWRSLSSLIDLYSVPSAASQSPLRFRAETRRAQPCRFGDFVLRGFGRIMCAQSLRRRYSLR